MIKKLFFTLFPLFFFLNCHESIRKNTSISNQIYSDSIQEWVREADKIATSSTSNGSNHLLQKILGNSETLANDSLKTKYFSQLSLSFSSSKDSILFRKFNKKAFQFASQTKDSLSLAEAHWDLASFYDTWSIKDSAYYNFAKAQELFASLKMDSEVARMYYGMALIQNSIKDYTGSESNIFNAIGIFENGNEFYRLYLCYNHLGNIYIGLKEYDLALEYHNEALSYLKKLEGTEIPMQATRNNIGMVYGNQGKYYKALPYFKAIIEDSTVFQKNPELYAMALNNYAYNRFKINDSIGVESQMKQSLKIWTSINASQGISRGHYTLADFYLAKKDTLKALTQARLAQSSAKQSGNNERLLTTLHLLVNIDPKNAPLYIQEYIALNDSLQQEERKIRDKFARIRFETDEFIAENVTLTQEKKLWAGIAVALLMLGLSIYIIADQRVKNQRLKFQQQQQEANNEIFTLMLSQNKKLDEGKKMEQKRISEELHDGVLGKMLGARMVLTGLNKKTDEEAINERANAITALKAAEVEIREISHELSNAAYSEIPNFISSVGELLSNVGKTNRINTSFVHDEKVDWDHLSGKTKINLYRIIQETTQNVVKHAQCKNLLINFASSKDNMIISVEDDGKGFEPKKKKKGIGVRNMGSRINSLGGTWTIESELGKGTKVTLIIPISYSNSVELEMTTARQESV